MRVDQININDYQVLLDNKVAETVNAFSHLPMPNVQVFPSPIEQYRLRAEFRVWHDDDDSFYIMFDPASKEKYRVDHYIPGAKLIQELMAKIRLEFLPNELLRRRLYQVDFLTTLSGQALVSLIYHKPLDNEWLKEAQALKQRLSTEFDINIIGRSRKQKILVDQDFVTESLHVDGRIYQYQQIENSFTQPNGQINQEMLTWSRKIAKLQSGDLLELYCGNGNFSIALADCFDNVVATEIARSSVKSAQYNLQLNDINNVVVGQASSEDFSAAYFENKSVKSLKDVDLNSYDFSTILVDPPRAGLDDTTIDLVKKFNNIIYISCNPETLKNNLEVLQETHSIEEFALFDQFPYTHHIESAVWLKIK